MHQHPSPLGIRRLHVVAALSVAAALFLSACGQAGYTYAGSAQLKFVYRVPASWHSYSGRSLAVAFGSVRDPSFQGAYPFIQGFDASPSPNLSDVTVPGLPVQYPVVLSWVRTLPFGASDAL